jgi:hypothetical protein
LRTPVAALTPIVTLADSNVDDTTVTELTVIPTPRSTPVTPAMKFAPVNETSSV